MYATSQPWDARRPHILVIACSDGRFQAQLDAFLNQHLAIVQYDRLYLPGGPGALATSRFDYSRADVLRAECRFLVEAHAIREVVLVFHGNAPDGPEEAMCADYRRKWPDRTTDRLREQQEVDLADLLHLVFAWPPDLKVHAYRAETTATGAVRFVDLLPGRGTAPPHAPDG